MSTPTVDTAPLKRQRRNRIYLQLTCVTISLFMLVPIYLISLAALSTRESLNEFPLSLIPNNISFDTLNAFLSSTGISVRWATPSSSASAPSSSPRSLESPAGTPWPGSRSPARTRTAVPAVRPGTADRRPLSPSRQAVLTANIYDTTYGVIMLHTSLALPTTILISASMFLSVPVDVEEAARIFGCGPFGAFARVVMPMALPGWQRPQSLLS